VAKLVARLLATAALWVRIQTSLKNNWRRKHRSGQHTLARPKNIIPKNSNILRLKLHMFLESVLFLYLFKKFNNLQFWLIKLPTSCWAKSKVQKWYRKTTSMNMRTTGIGTQYLLMNIVNYRTQPEAPRIPESLIFLDRKWCCSLVDGAGEVVYDTFVAPLEPVTDYRTRVRCPLITLCV
jgi:hypothetical protein